MSPVQIDERLPATALDAEVVLHVRRHLRTAIRVHAPSSSSDLAHLFGFSRDEGLLPEWLAAAAEATPLQAGAEVASRRRGRTRVVALGYEPSHVLECKRWLDARRRQDEVFSLVKASDLATLLELSKARDLSVACSTDERGHERYLPILIQGATGTGKELLADAIHQLWACALKRPDAPLRVIQVAGMPVEMINDELFGHVAGAYTGAQTQRKGRIEDADGGTLLIDEVGDLPPEAQLRLLRFLQTQTMSRLGESTERRLSVRILAATWHDLDADVRAGRFREDLLHRLRVGAGLSLQPLASREGFFDEVLPELLQTRRHKARPLITRSARDALSTYSWPGNLRELVGVIDTALAYGRNETLRVEHLPTPLQRQYLELPLYQRAPGFLLDQIDEQELSDEHIAWRVAELTHSFEHVPLPPPNEQWAAVGKLLSLLDDSSEEHRRSVSDVEHLLRLDQGRQQASKIEECWKQIATIPLPSSIAQHVARAQRDAEERRLAVEREIVQVQQKTNIDSNPWLRLLREIRNLPLLKSIDAGTLGNSFIGLFNLLKFAVPSLLDQIRDDARAGGLDRVRKGLARWFRESSEESEPEIEVMDESPLPGRLTRKNWQSIASRFPTQREAVEETGYDPKTIDKYFREHKITNPWRLKSRSNKRPSGSTRAGTPRSRT